MSDTSVLTAPTAVVDDTVELTDHQRIQQYALQDPIWREELTEQERSWLPHAIEGIGIVTNMPPMKEEFTRHKRCGDEIKSVAVGAKLWTEYGSGAHVSFRNHIHRMAGPRAPKADWIAASAFLVKCIAQVAKAASKS